MWHSKHISQGTSGRHKLQWRLIFVLIVLVLIGAFKLHSQSRLPDQPYPPSEGVKKPTNFGRTLLGENPDFRLGIFKQQIIDDRCKRGVVCYSFGGDLEGPNVSEYPTNQWQTIADAMQYISALDRKTLKPQFRIIQKDAILQSSICPPFGDSDTASGYSKGFLQQKLYAGDIIILLPRTGM